MVPQARSSIRPEVTPWDRGRGGRDMMPGSAGSRPSANTRNGTISGMAWAKM